MAEEKKIDFRVKSSMLEGLYLSSIYNPSAGASKNIYFNYSEVIPFFKLKNSSTFLQSDELNLFKKDENSEIYNFLKFLPKGDYLERIIKYVCYKLMSNGYFIDVAYFIKEIAHRKNYGSLNVQTVVSLLRNMKSHTCNISINNMFNLTSLKTVNSNSKTMELVKDCFFSFSSRVITKANGINKSNVYIGDNYFLCEYISTTNVSGFDADYKCLFSLVVKSEYKNLVSYYYARGMQIPSNLLELWVDTSISDINNKTSLKKEIYKKIINPLSVNDVRVVFVDNLSERLLIKNKLPSFKSIKLLNEHISNTIEKCLDDVAALHSCYGSREANRKSKKLDVKPPEIKHVLDEFDEIFKNEISNNTDSFANLFSQTPVYVTPPVILNETPVATDVNTYISPVEPVEVPSINPDLSIDELMALYENVQTTVV